MPIRDPRLRAALAAALLAGCTGDDTGDSDTEPQIIGTTPGDLDAVCAASSLLGLYALPSPVDFLAVRKTSDMTEDPHTEVESLGVACSGATDVAACETALADAWPTGTGWGYCGMGCTDTGLVWTRGDEVGLADAPDEVAAFFGTIDAPAEVLTQVAAHNYMRADCPTMRELDGGGYRIEAVYLTSDCEWTEETRLVEISPTGALTVIEVLDVYSDGTCAGRRPEGLCDGPPPSGDAVARHLAHLARLEAAAVVAFERLAVDLARHGAPTELVARARAAADDEVRHARVMSAIARAHGAEVHPIAVEPHQPRSFAAIARENTVEGCVRETFGVVDAMYRARHAPTAELRAAFAAIAEDEARHAELSWDIARWAATRLDAAERAALTTARRDAFAALEQEIRHAVRAEVEEAVGAPPRPAALAMLTALRDRLAA